MKAWGFVALLAIAAPALAQDDCPANHVRNPAISPLDHDYMVRAFQASFRAIYGREPTMQPGAGKDDGEYYIGAANHYGVYGDDQCHAGWSGYWESWLQNGHGDLGLVQTAARFLPAPVVIVPPIVTPPPPPPTPPQIVYLPAPAALPSTDLSAVASARVEAKVDAMAAEVHALKAEVESTWARYAGPILKYGAAIAAGMLAKWKLSQSKVTP